MRAACYAYDVKAQTWSVLGGGARAVAAGLANYDTPAVYVLSKTEMPDGNSAIFEYTSGSWSQLPGAGAAIAASKDGGTPLASGSGTLNPFGLYVARAQKARSFTFHRTRPAAATSSFPEMSPS